MGYFANRKQRVVLNSQVSTQEDISVEIPQGSVLDPLLFIIYINDLPDEMNSICKIFADDTSLFSKVYDSLRSKNELTFGHDKVNEWTF